MLVNAEIMEVVATEIQCQQIYNLGVDLVMVSRTGAVLVDAGAIAHKS
ncbi:MAG: hypothetical protein HC851_14305 [Acaryochloris sp. RU_4_1]|nr:hypothetical protein [Acaryochloris sp. RU_4_1]NJR56012.1 hypothetical protein [Acaryochloris sp. CRU_2_0]